MHLAGASVSYGHISSFYYNCIRIFLHVSDQISVNMAVCKVLYYKICLIINEQLFLIQVQHTVLKPPEHS